MRFKTKTEYGLISLIHMANSEPQGRITIKALSDRERYSYSYVEKIFQKLRTAGIVVSYQGNHGGYALARPPSEITVKEIVDALEGGTFDISCERRTPHEIICNHNNNGCGLKNIWHKTRALLDDFYRSLTLEMIAKNSTDIAGISALPFSFVEKNESRATTSVAGGNS